MVRDVESAGPAVGSRWRTEGLSTPINGGPSRWNQRPRESPSYPHSPTDFFPCSPTVFHGRRPFLHGLPRCSRQLFPTTLHSGLEPSGCGHLGTLGVGCGGLGAAAPRAHFGLAEDVPEGALRAAGRPAGGGAQQSRRRSGGSAGGWERAPRDRGRAVVEGEAQERPPEPRRSRKCWMRRENSRSFAISFSIFSTA